jgi:hypothetical protein
LRHITVINFIQNCVEYPSLKVKFICRQNFGIVNVGFDATDQLLASFFCIRQILEKKLEFSETVHQLYRNFKKAYDSVRREVFYNILIQFGISIKQVRLIKTCLNETYSKVHTGKHLSDFFLI